MSFLSSYRQVVSQTCLDLELGLTRSPAEESWLNRYHSIEITAFLSWCINNLSWKKHRSSKTLAKWNNAYIHNTGTSGNKFYKKNRLQSTFFFFPQIHCFPTSLTYLNHSQVIFEMGLMLINHTASWKMFLVPSSNNSSFDWSKTKQEQKTQKRKSDLGEWGSLSTLQPTGDSELWMFKLKYIFIALLAYKTRAALRKHMYTH